MAPSNTWAVHKGEAQPTLCFFKCAYCSVGKINFRWLFPKFWWPNERGDSPWLLYSSNLFRPLLKEKEGWCISWAWKRGTWICSHQLPRYVRYRRIWEANNLQVVPLEGSVFRERVREGCRGGISENDLFPRSTPLANFGLPQFLGLLRVRLFKAKLFSKKYFSNFWCLDGRIVIDLQKMWNKKLKLRESDFLLACFF